MEQPFKRRRVSRDDFTDEELRHRRARNDLRLKSAFERIFEKYGKDFTGIGDEIDLETGKIVVDRGHLSSLGDETDPGREEDLFDELDDEIWSGETRATTKQGHVRPRDNISPSENSLCSDLATEMRDSSQSFPSFDSLTGDAKLGILATDFDELGRLRGNKSRSNPKAHSPIYPAQAVQNENILEPKWRAPSLSDKVSTCQENPQAQNFLFSDACENRSVSPPGKSLWGLSERVRKHQLARRTDTGTPLSKLSGLSLSSIKQTHVRQSMTSLTCDWSNISINQILEQSLNDLSITNREALLSICKFARSLPWTQYEDHKLHYLKSEARVTDSQLAAAFPNRSETDIKERWLILHPNDENSIAHGARHRNDTPVHSISTSDVVNHGNALSSAHLRPQEEPISPVPIEGQPLKLYDTPKQQTPPVKPREIKQIPSTDPQAHHDSSQVPKVGTSVDLPIDLTFFDGEEATESAGSKYRLENSDRLSKQSEEAVNRTQGILKRVTRKSAAFNEAKERPFMKSKGAFQGCETDAYLYSEIPEVQDQAFPGSVSQPVPTSKKRNRLIVKAKRAKQLALNREASRVQRQKPSTPSKSMTSPLETSTEALPSSLVSTRSSRSSQLLKENNKNIDSYMSQSKESSTRSLKSKSPVNASTVANIQCTNSTFIDRPGTISSDGRKSDPNQICTKCSSTIIIKGEGILMKGLCSICFSQISRRPSSLERSTSLYEADRRKKIPNNNSGHTELRNREDSVDMDCLLEAQPIKIITPAKVRPQKLSSALSSTSTHTKDMKRKSIPLRTRVIDNLSGDELSMPVRNIRKSSFSKIISPDANTSRTKPVSV